MCDRPGFYGFQKIGKDCVSRYIEKDRILCFFDSTREIKKLELPDSIEEIGDCAFALKLPSNEGFEEIRLPKKLRCIGEAAFSSQLLTSITIPENVELIGDRAFKECYWLETVTVKSKKNQKSWRMCFSAYK